MSDRITSLADLEALYGEPNSASLLKETDRITPEYRAFVEAAPFAVLATAGPEGLDCSPRGDGPGFVRVADERTLLIPDRRGNNRIDSLRNILRDPRVALLFLIPGVGETLRVNGRAGISVAPDLLQSFKVQGKLPARCSWSRSRPCFFSARGRSSARSCGTPSGGRDGLCRVPATCWPVSTGASTARPTTRPCPNGCGRRSTAGPEAILPLDPASVAVPQASPHRQGDHP